jgi:carbamoyl-phosphate synthase large subunit
VGRRRLASIAKVAAKLAIGYTLDELRNEITGGATPASFEPTIDYVVTKVPRFAFEKFPAADDHLTTQMKSVGEVMAIGRTFQESFRVALRGLEVGSDGSTNTRRTATRSSRNGRAGTGAHLVCRRRVPIGMTLSEVFEETAIDPWFLAQIEELVQVEAKERRLADLDAEELRYLKRKDSPIAAWPNCSAQRWPTCVGAACARVRPVFKRVDTCAPSSRPRPPTYSTYEDECEAAQ